MKQIKFFINKLDIKQEVFKMKYSLDTYNWIVELQNNEIGAIRWGGQSYVPLSIEKDEENILVYLTLK